MSYYPKTKIQTNLFSNGELIKISDLSSYIGPYYKLSTGQRYIGATPQARRYPDELIDPSELTSIPTQGLFTEIQTSFSSTSSINTYVQNLKEIPTTKIVPTPFYPEPNSQDYEIGYFPRYFAKQVNALKFIEINKKTFENMSSHNDQYLWQLYKTTSLPWQISGDIEKVLNTNRKIVKLEEKNGFNGLSLFLKENYLQFYQGSGLYTSGGEFKTADNKNYVGFYHIHDSIGPMVGKVHIKESHERLFPIRESNVSQVINQQIQITSTNTTSSYTPPPINTGGGGFSGGGFIGGGGGGY
jgi:hypothetical protein